MLVRHHRAAVFTITLFSIWRLTSENIFLLFTKGNIQFSHNETHSTQRGFPLLPTPYTDTHRHTQTHTHNHPMENHCSAPFSKCCIWDISSLTPGIQFCETRWERFCRGNEVESGIIHCARLSWITSAREGWVWKEIQCFATSVSEAKNETDAPWKSRSGQKRQKRKERRATLSRWTCLHLSDVAKVVPGEPEASVMSVLFQLITRKDRSKGTLGKRK